MKRTTRLFSLLITAAMLLNMAACANKPSEAASSAATQSGSAAEAASQESGSDYSSWPKRMLLSSTTPRPDRAETFFCVSSPRHSTES